MSVQCVDCENWFTDEAWADHDNSTDCVKVRSTGLVWFGLWLAGVAMGLVLLSGVTVAWNMISDPSEDSTNPLLNCYVYGDGDCGPNAPWHGYVNI